MNTQWRDSDSGDVWPDGPPPRDEQFPDASTPPNGPALVEGDADLAVDPGSSGGGVLRRAFAGIGAALDFILHLLGRAIATIWRMAGALDAALWHGAVHAARAVLGVLGAAITLLGDSAIDFVRWLPSRGGRAYFAVSGLVLIVSSLWIVDELQRAEAEPQGAFDGPVRAPVDLDDPILARIRGRYIHLSDVAATSYAAGLIDAPNQLTPRTAFDRGFVRRHVEQRLIADAAIDAGLMRDPEVARQIGLARDRILAAAYLEARVNDASNPALVDQIYESQSDIVKLGDEVIARQIVVETEIDAEAALIAISQGADFEKLAREISLDRATAQRGGRMDPFTRLTVAPALSRAAFSTTPGEFAPLVSTEHGWHVMQVLERQPSSTIELDQVRDRIQEFLTMKTIDATLQSLADDNDVIYYQPTNTASAEG